MIELLYIASPSFSGSTLLTFLLAAHPRVATIGELKATSMGDVETYRCSCGERILECAFWRRLREAMAERGEAFEVARFGTHFRFGPARPLANRLVSARLRGRAGEWCRTAALALMPRVRRGIQRVRERNRAVIETICALRGANVFLDGSKDPVRLRFLLDLGAFRPAMIHLIRDGRGVAASYMRVHGCSMEEAAWEWRDTNEECERLRRRLPAGASLQLRYEDLCRDVPGSLRQAFALVGESAVDGNGDFRAIDHHILGNAMRLQPGGTIEVRETWRTSLSPDDLRTFDRIAGGLNRRFGYV